MDINSDVIILWSKEGGEYSDSENEYKDKTIYQDNEYIIMEYWGQRSGRRDHLIKKGAIMIKCNGKPRNTAHRIYIGTVLDVIKTDLRQTIETKQIKSKILNTQLYKLVIKKQTSKAAKTKNELCYKLGLSNMNNFERTNGITSHTRNNISIINS